MFVVIQFPFADIRPFLPEDTHHLPVPAWPMPEPDIGFLRYFGAIKPRRRGGISDWPGEESYGRAKRALRFMPHFGNLDKDGSAGIFRQRYCAFRRLMADGQAVARLELGVGYRRYRNPADPMDGAACLAFIRSNFDTPVRVPGSQRNFVSGMLFGGAVERHLAQMYLKATTSHDDDGQLKSTEKWWVKAGTPLTLIEYVIDRDVAVLPSGCKAVTTLKDPSVDLAYCRLEFHGRRLGVWLLGIRPGETNMDFLRRLRINLLRLHAEKEGIKHVLRLIGQERVNFNPDTAKNDTINPWQHLQDYLDRATRFLSKKSFYGLPQSDILAAAQDFEEIVSEGERETLLSRLAPIRRNLLKTIEIHTAPKEPAAGTIIVFAGDNTTVKAEQNGSKTVTNQSLNLGGQGSIFYGDVNVNQVAAKTIQESFNRVANADVDTELKDQLKELAKAVGEMLKAIPDEKQQEEVARDLETLTSEVLSDSPRPKWYQLSAEGLIQAAKNVGEIAEPVVKAATAVLALLG